VSAPAQAGTGQAADKPADAKGAVTDSDQTTAIRPQGIADAPTEAIRVDKVNQPAPSAPAANPLFSKPAQPQARPEAPKSGIPGRAAAAAAGAVAAGAAAVGKLQSIGKPQSIGTPPTGKPEQPASGSKPGEAGSKPGAAADAAATSDAASGAKDSAKSGLTSPTEVIKPDAAKPDTAEPDTAKPDTAKPDTAKPDTAKPDAAKDAPAGADTTAKPDTTKSDAGAAAQKPSAPDGSEAATQAISAIRPPAEPGEERPDPAAAAIVAKLGDEVLVVDEQPRYHLAGCRTLSGQETIPLPAREAVEYEFSPCAECTPVRILAARNRASSKS
jgi:hypothetical protein